MTFESDGNRLTGMKVNLTLRNTTAFAALLFVMHEFHEIAHTAVGRLICGCWGERNFNTWGLCCENEYTILASIAGPLFTYLIMYSGYYLLSSRYDNLPSKKSVGFALVFANMPAARIFTALMGGGDELLELVRAYKTLSASQRLWGFTGFLLLPFIFDILVVIIGMNKLYEQGVLDQTGIIGSPLIVNLWTLLWITVLAFSWKSLRTMLIPDQDA